MGRCTASLFVCALAAAIGSAAPVSSAAQNATGAPRRVLLLHSYGPHFSPWNAIAGGFRQELIKQSPYPIDLYEASLQSGRFGQLEDQRPLVNYLRALFAGQQLDLVVAMGAPAARFLRQTRSELFPSAPLLISGAHQRALDGIPLGANDAVVSTGFDQATPFDSILRVLPDTSNIAVIHGATPIERFWVQEYHRSIQRLTNRVTFEWLNELSLEDLVKRVAQLPLHSVIYYTTFHLDADGVPQENDRVFHQLRKVANAPIFSYIDILFGQGIVGGPMLSAQEVARRSALAAIRILRGEPADSIKTPALGLSTPVYDWRELQRWKISEAALPPGSIVQFREPTAWQRYRVQILAVGAAFLLQTFLILWFLQEHRRRRMAEAEALQRVNELARMNRFATAGELAASIAHEIRQPLSAIVTAASAGLNWLKRPTPDLVEARLAMENAVEQSHRADDVIKGVGAMFRKETQQRKRVDLNELIEQVVAIAAGAMKSSEIALDANLTREAPPVVSGDPIQLQQVILNLVMNAVEAMSRATNGPRILQIETEARTAATAVIWVRDSGPSIDPKVADNMFQPFFTTKPGGMGMGLSICRTIVEAHGGSLTASPNNPHGMEFQIVLPHDRRR